MGFSCLFFDMLPPIMCVRFVSSHQQDTAVVDLTSTPPKGPCVKVNPPRKIVIKIDRSSDSEGHCDDDTFEVQATAVQAKVGGVPGTDGVHPTIVMPE